MPGPKGALTVRVNDGVTDRLVTRHVRGLRFRKTAPGGHHSASMRLLMPAGAFRDLGPADKVWVYDARTSRCVWEGYTENPGTEDGPDGQAFDLSALGGQVLTADNSRPAVFIERSLSGDHWDRITTAVAGGTDQIVDGNILRLQFPAGIPVGFGSEVQVAYHGLARSGQRLAAAESRVVAGKTDAGNYAHRIWAVDEGVASTLAGDFAFTTSEGVISATFVTDFPNTCETVLFSIVRTGGATNVADDLTWGSFRGPYVRPILAKADGTDHGSVAGTDYLTFAVRAHEVVNHVLGTMLPMVDGPGARVDATSFWITQMTYHQGATPRRILDDLSLFEPDYLWEIGETNAAGKHRFAYRAWPTEARYEISVRDGYSAPGGDADLCNRIVVYWTDGTSGRHSTVVTSTVPELGSRVRDAQPITLPQGMGSEENAQRIGEMVLASKATPPKAARAVVRRPILDRQTGAMVLPWEIEPGYLVAVRETGDLLRLTEMDYDDDAVATTLTLGTPQRTIEQMLAGLGLSQGIAA